MELRWIALGMVLAFLITGAFLIHPSPALMALFVFFAQPLFLIMALLYLKRVYHDLRRKGVF